MNTLIVIIHVNHDEFFELASLSCNTTLITRFGRSIDSKVFLSQNTVAALRYVRELLPRTAVSGEYEKLPSCT